MDFYVLSISFLSKNVEVLKDEFVSFEDQAVQLVFFVNLKFSLVLYRSYYS